MTKWIDFHTHILDESPQALANAVAQSMEMRVEKWLVNSVDVSNWLSHKKKAEKVPLAIVGLGWHPEQVIQVSQKEMEPSLQKYASAIPSALFLGETGLDYLYGKTEKERVLQQHVFTFFIHQSLQHKKLLEVHTRHAKQEAIDLLQKHGAKNVLLHWFSGNKKQIQTIIENKWVCSVGPTILNSPHVDKFIQAMPLELLALETDSPIPFDGKPSSPAWISRVAEKVAQLKELELSEVAKAQSLIFKRFFP